MQRLMQNGALQAEGTLCLGAPGAHGHVPLSLWQSKHGALKSKASTDTPRRAGEGGVSKTAHGAPNPTKSERNDLATNCPR